jgi:hypothetical protein
LISCREQDTAYARWIQTGYRSVGCRRIERPKKISFTIAEDLDPASMGSMSESGQSEAELLHPRRIQLV